MIVLDSDHLSALQMPGPRGQRLTARLTASGDPDVTTTIVNVEEALRGWLAAIHKAHTPAEEVAQYAHLQRFIALFAGLPLLAFDSAASDKYQDLRALRLRNVGTQDLRIAAIALTRGALLLSANLRDFRQVPGLRVEDWINA